jgi:hypothetical protein
VPIDLLGNASLILDEAYFRLLKHLEMEGDVERYRFREGTTANYYDTRLLELFDVDFRRIFLPKRPEAKINFKDSDTTRGPWGVVWSKSGIYVNPVSFPLRDLDIDGVATFEWPQAEALYHTEGLSEHARQLHEGTEYALVARNPLTWGFLDRGCTLRGTDQFMMDMVLNPELAQMIIDHVLEIHLQVYDMFLQAVGPYVLMVETGDDLGAQCLILCSRPPRAWTPNGSNKTSATDSFFMVLWISQRKRGAKRTYAPKCGNASTPWHPAAGMCSQPAIIS